MIIILAILLTIKHFLCDVKFQSFQMTLDKRAEGWKGTKGLLKHSGIHALGTWIVVALFLVLSKGIVVALIAGFIFAMMDLQGHYVVDMFKVDVEKVLKPEYKSRSWWILLGFDQAAHFAFYGLFIWMLWV